MDRKSRTPLRWSYLYLAYFSKPKADRVLYRQVKKLRAARIVEIGIVSLLRTRRLIEVATRYAGGSKVRYTGFDAFDARARNLPALSVKDIHRALNPTRIPVRLVPGDAAVSLGQSANALVGTDLLIISASQQQAGLDRAWFYVPRMLHERTLVLLERVDARGGTSFEPLSSAEVQRRANAVPRRRAA
jgi:hypothetical protein